MELDLVCCYKKKTRTNLANFSEARPKGTQLLAHLIQLV